MKVKERLGRGWSEATELHVNLWPPPPLQIVYLQGYILGSLRSRLKADCLSRAFPHNYPLPCPLQVLSRIAHGCLMSCSCLVTVPPWLLMMLPTVCGNKCRGVTCGDGVCLFAGRKGTDVKLVQGLWWSGFEGGYSFCHLSGKLTGVLLSMRCREDKERN